LLPLTSHSQTFGRANFCIQLELQKDVYLKIALDFSSRYQVSEIGIGDAKQVSIPKMGSVARNQDVRTGFLPIEPPWISGPDF